MDVLVNGARRELSADTTVALLVAQLGLGGRRFAVEVNEEIVPRSLYGERGLRPGDRVEIVQAIGGG
jgi:sulfur carrier protein